MILCFVAVLWWTRTQVRSFAYTGKEEKIRQVVQTAWGILDYYGTQAEKGALSVPQAQRNALEALRGLRYGGNEYFWVNDMTPRMVMHPINAALNGQDLSDYHDPNGFRLFAAMARICQEKGEGLVRYLWPKPGSSRPVEKFSYVKLYRPWGWCVGSGVYVGDVEEQIGKLTKLTFAVSFVVAAFTLVGFHRLGRSIARPLSAVTEELVKDSEEIREVVVRVTENGVSVSAGSQQQAASLEKTGTALGELSESMGEATRRAHQISELMTEVGVSVDGGQQQMNEMTGAIASIRESSQRVAKVLSAIDEIAFQTNLLALNAAVEAARAGQAGVGFAVVAEEVRGLAQKTSQAAKQTGEIIGDSLAKADSGTALSEQFAHSFRGIVSKIQDVSAQAREIQEQSQPQNERIANIREAVEQLTAITRANAENSRQALATTRELQGHADAMSHLLDPLAELIQGSH